MERDEFGTDVDAFEDEDELDELEGAGMHVVGADGEEITPEVEDDEDEQTRDDM